MTRFLAVHTLKLKGLASAEAVAEVTGLDPAEVTPVLDGLVEDGHAKLRTGRVAGYALTPDGRAAHAGLLAEHRTPEETAGATAAYEAFVGVNERFKEVCTRWQLRGDQPNDHSDAGYDAAVVEELAVVHADVVSGLEPATTASERFARYPVRFAAALDRVRAGETAAFARPMSASYHDVWMELHEDLLLTLGRQRAAADGH